MERAQKYSATLCTTVTRHGEAVPMVSVDAAALAHKDHDEKAEWDFSMRYLLSYNGKSCEY